MNTKYLVLIITLFLVSCSQGKPKQVEVNTDTMTVYSQPETSISQEMTDDEIEAELKAVIDSSSDSESLNEIRFGSWTEKDWYDNDYFRFLRKCINDCLKGIENDNTQQLQNYKSVLKDKFFIYDASPYIGGGLFITFGFLNNPEVMYRTVVYSDVDEDTETPIYKLRGFEKLEETSDITKEDILQIVKEHPENKLW
jgi:hypothetical protein